MKTIKKIILFFTLLYACSFQFFAQNDIQQNYTKEEIQIEMRDGVKLFTSVYAPRDKSISYPILIIRMPFNSEPDKDRYSKWPSWFPHLLKEKYILVFQDVRGKYMSEGEFVEVRPYNSNKKNKETDENSDAYDTIDWLVHNVDNNNGYVGVFGISAMGFYATMTLPNAHPALKYARVLLSKLIFPSFSPSSTSHCP